MITKIGFAPTIYFKGNTNPIGQRTSGYGISFCGNTLTEDTFERKEIQEAEKPSMMSTDKVAQNKAVFNAFITTDKYDSVISGMDFKQYGKDGIPLKYSRDAFLTDLSNEYKKLSSDEKLDVGLRFNIVLNRTRSNEVGVELEGMPKIPKDLDDSETEQNFARIIKKFTQENETLLENPQEKEVFDAIIQEVPEFTAIVGKKQHDTHDYSIDIHTLCNLKDNLSNDYTKELNNDSMQVLKSATLLHDIGKRFIADDMSDSGHAIYSHEISQGVMERLDLKPEVKERSLKQIKDHHWFESYNQGYIDAGDVVKRFGNEQDVTIAEIMAKSDLKNVNGYFHRYCMRVYDDDKVKANENFEKAMQARFSKIDAEKAEM